MTDNSPSNEELLLLLKDTTYSDFFQGLPETIKTISVHVKDIRDINLILLNFLKDKPMKILKIGKHRFRLRPVVQFNRNYIVLEYVRRRISLYILDILWVRPLIYKYVPIQWANTTPPFIDDASDFVIWTGLFTTNKVVTEVDQ